MKNFLILGTVISLAACSPNESDVCGIYFGTLPAADAPGIETTVNLKNGNQMSQRLVYIDKKDGVFDEKGTYGFDNGIVAINIPGDAPIYYRYERNQLRRLDMDMQPISGNLEKYYILKKVSGCK